MSNPWKRAFFILLTVFIMITGFLVYTITDMGIKIADMYDGYSDMQEDLEQISGAMIGKLSREDFTNLEDVQSSDATSIQLNTLRIAFGEDGKVKGVSGE